MSVLDDARIVVPFELSRTLRRKYRRQLCALCYAPLDQGRAIASTNDPAILDMGHDPDAPARPLWLVHHPCYLHHFRQALQRGLAYAPTEDDAHEAFRDALTSMVRSWAEQQPSPVPE